jgi:hypothetical protein
MSASTATGAIEIPASAVGTMQDRVVKDGLTAAQLVALAGSEDVQTLLGVSAMSTRLLNQIALQVEDGVASLATIAGPFDGQKRALTTQGSLDSDTVDRFAKAAAQVVQESVKPQFDAVQGSLAKAQSELDTGRTWSAAAGVRIDRLEALAGGFARQEQIVELIGKLVVENQGIGRELACICRSARAIARHMCGEDPGDPDRPQQERSSEWAAELREGLRTAHQRIEQFEHEIKIVRHDHELRAAVEHLREGVETRIAEVEAARLSVAERALEQHEQVRELRAAQAVAQESLARLELRVASSLEARQIGELVTQMEARLNVRLADLAAEREEHVRRAANAAERVLFIAGEHERIRERLDRLPGEITETLGHNVRELLADHDARLETRLAEIVAVSESGLRRSEDADARFDHLHHEQTRLNERIEQVGKDVAVAADVSMRAMLVETVETRLAEFAAARDTDLLRAEVAERIAAFHEEQKQMHAHLERLAQSISPEAREREIGEHLARERKWVEARLAELASARGGRPHTRP